MTAEPLPNTSELTLVQPGITDAAYPDATPDLLIEATYQDGVLRPHTPLELPANTRLQLRITPVNNIDSADALDRHSHTQPDTTCDTSSLAASAAPPLRLKLLIPLGAALALGAWGQYRFLEAQAFSWEAFLFYALAIAIFTLTVTYAHHPIFQSRPMDIGRLLSDSASALRRNLWRVFAMLGSLGLMGILLYLLQRTPPLPSYNGGLLLWLAAIGLHLVAVADIQPHLLRLNQFQEWKTWWRRSFSRSALQERLHPPRLNRFQEWKAWWQWGAQHAIVLMMALVTLLALGLRVWNVGTIPPTLGGDEGSQGLEALRVLKGEITNPFNTGWLGVPTMSFYFNALTVGTLGNTMFALRLPWSLVGAATVLVVFFLVRRLCGATLGLVTAVLLATYHYHIHFSRLGSNQVADGLFVALALLFLYRGYDRRNLLDWVVCGIAIGTSQYFYAGARFTGVLVASVVLFLAIRDGVLPFLRQRYLELLVLSSAVLISGAPMIQYSMRFPDDYNARVNEVGIFQSGWIEEEMQARGQGMVEILLDQTKRAAFAFNLYADRTVWYGSPEPLMNFAAAVLFLIGLGYGVLHIMDRRIFPMVAWWGGAMLMGGALTESPPSSQRLTTLAAPAIFFVALTLMRIGQVTLQALNIRRPERVLWPYLGIAVILLSAISIKWYFIDFTPTLRYGSYNAVVATSIGRYAHDHLGPDARMYFFGPPRMYIGFGSVPYLAPDVEGQDIHEPLTAPPAPGLVQPDKDAIFIFLPERSNELDLVRQTFPKGELEVVPSPVPGKKETMYTMYRVRREDL